MTNGSTAAIIERAKATRPPTRKPLQDWQKREKVAAQMARMWVKQNAHMLGDEEVNEIHDVTEVIKDLISLRDEMLRERLSTLTR
jgi:hypothetical protein